jgi:hypothetical protein
VETTGRDVDPTSDVPNHDLRHTIDDRGSERLSSTGVDDPVVFTDDVVDPNIAVAIVDRQELVGSLIETRHDAGPVVGILDRDLSKDFERRNVAHCQGAALAHPDRLNQPGAARTDVDGDDVTVAIPVREDPSSVI